MDSKKMIELIKIKEEGIDALQQYDKENGRLCSYVNLCQDMAKKFIELHSKAFEDKQILRDVIDYLEDMMSYESFGDALYQQLVYSNNEQDQQELVR